MFDDILNSADVAIATGCDGYPHTSPYSPGVSYPEYPFGSDTLSNEKNDAYIWTMPRMVTMMTGSTIAASTSAAPRSLLWRLRCGPAFMLRSLVDERARWSIDRNIAGMPRRPELPVLARTDTY